MQVISEISNVSETKFKSRSIIKLINEQLSVFEQKVYNISLIISGIVKVVNETIRAHETLSTARELNRIVSEAIFISDNILKVRAIIKVINQIVHISEITFHIIFIIYRFIVQMVSKIRFNSIMTGDKVFNAPIIKILKSNSIMTGRKRFDTPITKILRSKRDV